MQRARHDWLDKCEHPIAVRYIGRIGNRKGLYLLRILCATFVCRALACKHLCTCICYLSKIIRSRYVGVELLDYSEGLASGVFDGVRYFRCVSQWREE